MGTFDGKGEAWWGKGAAAGDRPSALGFHGCKNLEINGTTHMNSPRSHIEVENCNNATISNVNIIAPKDSPNTDGVIIALSKHVSVLKSSIATGDDCISIKNGSYNINAMDVKCGPGHGISVGSLGVGGSFETVEYVHVRSCSFTNTLNGARVKTWAGGAGYARNILFEDITLSNSGNPIIIDQHYCNGPHICPEKGKAVEVSNVTFRGFHGTTATVEAITLDCSKTKICSDIHIEHINITLSPSSSYTDKDIRVSCNNARGTASGLISPSDVPCFHQPPSPSPSYQDDDDDDEFFM
ncbi:PREDICTED: probable polygalacturonase At3g15720 [Tarenaya hassleriana]|uniref:probable polygalacturonase At3g15720 n=1 Tax=Tarenaya hassleriana TaxID=28532 RepID=UPI00053CA38F|nr:PREDICTED: probable polygalacturonase At3g15720 [Tarenaya hassleriana]